MKISREFVPFQILKQIGDPAYQIFRDAYASKMGSMKVDELMQNLVDRNDALSDREMGWCIPDLGEIMKKFDELDFDNPLFTETIPYFDIPECAKAFSPEKRDNLIHFSMKTSNTDVSVSGTNLHLALKAFIL